MAHGFVRESGYQFPMSSFLVWFQLSITSNLQHWECLSRMFAYLEAGRKSNQPNYFEFVYIFLLLFRKSLIMCLRMRHNIQTHNILPLGCWAYLGSMHNCTKFKLILVGSRFSNRVSCSPGWPQIHHIAEATLKSWSSIFLISSSKTIGLCTILGCS